MIASVPRRLLPTPDETRLILAEKRTRPARRPPPPAGAALARTLKGFDARFGGGAGALAPRWREIVGELLCKRTEPARLIRPRGAKAADGGATLELRVDGPAAVLVEHQQAEILSRANLVLGAGAVTRLRIVQGPVRAAAVRVPASAPRRRLGAPLDAAAEAEIAAGLADVVDGRLKSALLKLGRAVRRAE